MTGERPRISVLVFVGDRVEGVRACLESLARQEGIEGAEVLLADGSEGTATDVIATDFPWVRHLRLAPAAMPVLKAAGIRAAAGDIIAILDPVDTADTGWLREAVRGLEHGASAAGGTVLLEERASAASTAAYLFEYGAFTPPLAAGPTTGDLPGNNVAYRRQALLAACGEDLAEGFWKPFCHARIRRHGGRFVLHPPMRVSHHALYGPREIGARFFHFGRCFGAMRLAREESGARRFLYRALVPAVPPLLVVRHWWRTLRHPHNRWLLPRAGLALACVGLAWGVGEWVGTWFGTGSSCSRVR